jgi:hypothetical protein
MQNKMCSRELFLLFIFLSLWNEYFRRWMEEQNHKLEKMKINFPSCCRCYLFVSWMEYMSVGILTNKLRCIILRSSPWAHIVCRVSKFSECCVMTFKLMRSQLLLLCHVYMLSNEVRLKCLFSDSREGEWKRFFIKN